MVFKRGFSKAKNDTFCYFFGFQGVFSESHRYKYFKINFEVLKISTKVPFFSLPKPYLANRFSTYTYYYSLTFQNYKSGQISKDSLGGFYFICHLVLLSQTCRSFIFGPVVFISLKMPHYYFVWENPIVKMYSFFHKSGMMEFLKVVKLFHKINYCIVYTVG